MLDPKLIKEKPEMIKNMLKSRVVEFDLEGLIESDQKRREFIIKTDELRKKKNQIATWICSNTSSMVPTNCFMFSLLSKLKTSLLSIFST